MNSKRVFLFIALLLALVPLLCLGASAETYGDDFRIYVDARFITYSLPENLDHGSVSVYCTNVLDGDYLLLQTLELEEHLSSIRLDEVLPVGPISDKVLFFFVKITSDGFVMKSAPVAYNPGGYTPPVWSTQFNPVVTNVPTVESYPVQNAVLMSERNSVLTVLKQLQYSSIWSFVAIGVGVVLSFLVLNLIYNKSH